MSAADVIKSQAVGRDVNRHFLSIELAYASHCIHVRTALRDTHFTHMRDAEWVGSVFTSGLRFRLRSELQQRLQWRFRLSASTVAIQGFHDRDYRVDRRHPNRQALGATATPGGPLTRCPTLLRFLLKVTQRCAPATS